VSVDCSRSNVVVDAAGLFAGVNLSYSVVYTVEQVTEEVLDKRSRRGVELALASGKLVVTQASENFRRRVMEVARKLGVLYELSKADLEVLALAYYVKERCGSAILYTDDTLVQNVAISLGVAIEGLKYPGRTRVRRYVYVCKACGYRSAKPGECPRCGNKLQLELST
jgi:UPF0271 protein